MRALSAGAPPLVGPVQPFLSTLLAQLAQFCGCDHNDNVTDSTACCNFSNELSASTTTSWNLPLSHLSITADVLRQGGSDRSASLKAAALSLHNSSTTCHNRASARHSTRGKASRAPLNLKGKPKGGAHCQMNTTQHHAARCAA